jgi:hypothetical protein
MLASGLPSDATLSDGSQQLTFFNMQGYFGPGACNVYEFTLYALSSATLGGAPADTDAVKAALDGAGALATAQIRGRADMSYCN